MSDTHLIWFNGTGETTKDTKHLFEDLNSDQYTVVPGWGTEGFKGKSWTEKGAITTGVLQEDLPKINEYIDDKKFFEKLKNKHKVIIGGFSRGAAFFVPYFLNFMLEKRNKLNEQQKKDYDFKKLMIVLMDPVTGTGNNQTSVNFTGNTVNTLKSINLFTYTDKVKNLIEPLTNQCEVYGIVLCPCFDKRATYFSQDGTFLAAFKQKNENGYVINPENLYFTRIGIVHSILSCWEPDPEKYPYRHKIMESLILKDKYNNKFNVLEVERNPDSMPDHIDENVRASIQEIHKMLDLDLSKCITNRLFQSLLSDRPKDFEYGTSDEEHNLFYALDTFTNTTNSLLENFCKISYKEKNSAYWGNTSKIKEGMRKIETDHAEKLKKLLENWRS